MQSRDLLIWCMRRGDGTENSAILIPITELRFLQEQNPSCAVFTSDLESERSAWGLTLWEFSLYEACLSGVQSKVAAKAHGAAQLSAPRTAWDSFQLELEYIFGDFVFRIFLLLTFLKFVFHKPDIRSHDLAGSWPAFEKLWSRWRWKATSLKCISFFCLKDRALSMLVKQQQQQH